MWVGDVCVRFELFGEHILRDVHYPIIQLAGPKVGLKFTLTALTSEIPEVG